MSYSVIDGLVFKQRQFVCASLCVCAFVTHHDNSQTVPDIINTFAGYHARATVLQKYNQIGSWRVRKLFDFRQMKATLYRPCQQPFTTCLHYHLVSAAVSRVETTLFTRA